MNISWRSALLPPNLLSLGRIVLIPVISWLLIQDSPSGNFWAGILLVIAAITDLLDGFLARLLNQKTDLGRLLDPLADKLFAASFVVVLLVIREFPLWLLLLILIKEAGILLGGLYVMKRHQIVMESRSVGKYAFASQLLLIISYYIRFPFGQAFFTLTTVVLILATMVTYFISFRRRMNNRQSRPWTAHSRRFFLLLRIWLVAMGMVVVLLHAWFWLYESSYLPEEAPRDEAVIPDWVDDLAADYAPVVVVGGKAQAPIDPVVYFETADFSVGSRWFAGSFDQLVSREEALDTAASYISTGVPPGSIRGPGRAFYSFKRIPEDRSRVRSVISYWFFFHSQSVPVHRQGIWRSVSIYFDRNNNPLFTMVTRDWHGQAVPWNQTEVEHGRPVVYVGEKSAGITLAPGEFKLSMGPDRIISVFSDTAHDGSRFRPHESYLVERLDPGSPLFAWRGLWGGPVPGGDLGPRYWHPKNVHLSPYNYPLKTLHYYLSGNRQATGGAVPR